MSAVKHLKSPNLLLTISVSAVVSIAASLAVSFALSEGRPGATSGTGGGGSQTQSLAEQLKENPEMVVEAIRTWQARQQRGPAASKGAILSENRDALLNQANDPSIGPADADVTVVEFYDYACPYCIKMQDRLAELIEQRPDVRVVFKEFPVLSEPSRLAARVSLAVHEMAPEHWYRFHDLLMGGGRLTPDKVWRAVAEIGLERAAVEARSSQRDIAAAIAADKALARRLDIRGTPALIIGDSFISGLVPMERLVEAVERAGDG